MAGDIPVPTLSWSPGSFWSTTEVASVSLCPFLRTMGGLWMFSISLGKFLNAALRCDTLGSTSLSCLHPHSQRCQAAGESEGSPWCSSSFLPLFSVMAILFLSGYISPIPLHFGDCFLEDSKEHKNCFFLKLHLSFPHWCPDACPRSGGLSHLLLSPYELRITITVSWLPY